MNKNLILAVLVAITIFGSAANAAEFKTGLDLGLGVDVFQDATQKFKSVNRNGEFDSVYREKTDQDTDLTIGGHVGFTKIFVFGNQRFAFGAELGGSVGGPEGESSDSWSGSYTIEDDSSYYYGDEDVKDVEQVNYATTVTTKQEIDATGEFRIKVGYLPLPNLMVSVFGGPVVAHATETETYEYTRTHIVLADESSFVEESRENERNGKFGIGYLVGASVAYKAFENVSVVGEAFYRDVSFDSHHSSDGEDYNFSSATSNDGIVARLVVNFHFDL